MAKCYIKCELDAQQSDVSTITDWLTANGHEAIYSDISDAEVENHIRIFSDVVVVKAGNMKALFNDAQETPIGDGVKTRFCFGDEARYIEKCLKFLNAHL